MGEVFLKLLNMSLTASFLIVAVILRGAAAGCSCTSGVSSTSFCFFFFFILTALLSQTCNPDPRPLLNTAVQPG